MSKKVKYASGSKIVFADTEIGKTFIGNDPEFTHHCYTSNDEGETKGEGEILRMVSKKWAAGLKVELVKTGRKRADTISVEMGRASVELMIEFLESIKSEIKEYEGTVSKTETEDHD